MDTIATPGPHQPKPILSSSPAFVTPAHPIRLPPLQHASQTAHVEDRTAHPPSPRNAAILPIDLPASTLRPTAFRTFTKKHNLTLTSSALQALATFVGRHCGSRWREEGLAEPVLEDVARSWKKVDGTVIVDTTGDRLKAMLKALEGSMSGGKVGTARAKDIPGLSRESSSVGSSLDKLLSEHRRPSATRNESLDSFGMSTLEVAEEEEDEQGSKEVQGWLKVVNAFEQPRMLFNPKRKHFEKLAQPPSLLAAPEVKTESFRQRYHIIQQRLLRNEAFQTTNVTSQQHGSGQSWKVTSIANLLGRSGTGHLILGLLAIAPTGSLAVSDLTGTIQLDLEQAACIDDIETWLCPGMIVLVDGVYEEEYNSGAGNLAGARGVGGTISGRFVGFSVGAPRCEPRAQSLGLSDVKETDTHSTGGGFGWTDFLGVGSERGVGSRMRKLEQKLLHDVATAGANGKAIILGQMSLSEPKTLLAIRKIFISYTSTATNALAEDQTSSLASLLPTAFVLFGPFARTAALSDAGSTTNGQGVDDTSSIGYKNGFDALAALLHDFPLLLRHCSFIFVPGDNDPWPSAFASGAACPLPRSGIPEMFTRRIKREFATANADTAARIKETKGRGEISHGMATWTTNPSRISLFGPQQELVLFRDDISGRLRRNAIPLARPSKNPEVVNSDADPGLAMADAPSTTQAQDDAMEVDTGAIEPVQGQESNHDGLMDTALQNARRLTKTLLDQTHLSPFPLSIRPLHWAHAHTLSLFPLPSALVICDTKTEVFTVVYQGCCVVNAGMLVCPANGSTRERARWVEYDLRTQRGAVREALI